MQLYAYLKQMTGWDRCSVGIMRASSWQRSLDDLTEEQRWRGAVSIDTSGGSPTMDYHEHIKTYHAFLKGTKWLIGLVVLTLVLMAIFLL